MLRNQLQTLLKEFEQKGGFTENMTDTRLETRKAKAASQGAPVCKKCGATMILKMARKRVNAGKQFWSCSNYHTSGCNYTEEYYDC